MTASTRKLTSRDSELLDTLTRRVRVMSFDQVARQWWGGQRRALESAARRLTALDAVGLVQLLSGFAHPELPMTAPVAAWRPGEPAPDFGSVSYRLRSRWTEPLRVTKAVIATKLAAAQFGGSGGRSPRPSELTHDIHLATVFLNLRQTRPDVAQTWQSEADQYAAGAGRDERLPDAIVGKGRARMAIEFGGAYSKPKVAEFHQHCEERGLGYELW